MIKYNKILVPVDGSPISKRALAHAVSIAETQQAKICLLNVANVVSTVSNFDAAPIVAARVSEQVAKDLEDAAREIMAMMRKEIPEEIQVEEILQVGTPGPIIIDVAKEQDVDLIVMGSRGFGVLKGIFLGSVSTYVVRHEEFPVLIVK